MKKKFKFIPIHPSRQIWPLWNGWLDFLGKRVPNKFDKNNAMPFEEARKIIKRLGLKSQKEYDNWCKSGDKPNTIPSDPDRWYSKTKDWISWGDFLGTDVVSYHKRDKMPYNELRALVIQHEVKSQSDWRKFCKQEGLPHDRIPRNPDFAYKGQGWVSWGEFLGTNIVACDKKEFLSYEEQQQFGIDHGIKSEKQWKQYVKMHKPKGIPYNPASARENRGKWVNWGTFLKTGNLLAKDRKKDRWTQTRKLARSLGLRNQTEWFEWFKQNQPEGVRCHPDRNNPNWKGWKDFLSNE